MGRSCLSNTNSRIPSTAPASSLVRNVKMFDHSAAERDSMSDRPDEAEQFARDSGCCYHGAFSTGGQLLVGLVKTQLGLPGDVNDLLWSCWSVLLHPLSDLGCRPVIPGGLAQHCARE